MAGRQLLASEGVPGAPMADRIARACERITVHFARLVGLTGIHALFQRSMVLSSATFPWLVDGTGGLGGMDDDLFEALRKRLLPHPDDAAVDAFVLMLTTFVGQLVRLIGEDLVWRLLNEVWPTVFPDVAKESR